MILLWGVPGDAPLDAVHAALGHMGAEFRLLDQRRATATEAVFDVPEGGGLSGKIVDSEGEIDLAEVGSAYVRPLETSKACPGLEADDPGYLRAVMVDASMVAWADLSAATVVNRPAAMASNNSKPYQLRLIADSGLAVPDTLVTTDESAVRRFQDEHGTLIYKSVSGVRSIVSRLTCTDGKALANVANCPTQFQQYIPGTDVRVHVAGSAVLATEIVSAADDYRYASRAHANVAMAQVELPDEIATSCRRVVRRLGLSVAGIDFRRTPEGKWYCLEVNPSPGFSYYEGATGQPIAAAVAQFLMFADAHQAQCGPGLTADESRLAIGA
jgi:hypothetical protein